MDQLANSEVAKSLDLAQPKYYLKRGITSLANNSIERNTLECSIEPKDMLAPKYWMSCSSRNRSIFLTMRSGVPKYAVDSSRDS